MKSKEGEDEKQVLTEGGIPARDSSEAHNEFGSTLQV